MYGTCLRILHTYVQQHNNNTLKSTVSILKAAEREALEDENQSPKSGESSPVDDNTEHQLGVAPIKPGDTVIVK